MSKSVKLSIGSLVVAAGLAACGRAKTASNDDFSRDLQLASSSVDLAAPAVNPANLSTLETQPSSAPTKAAVVKKAPSGNKAVRSKTPTVHAAPVQEVAATDESNESETVVTAPAPDPTPEPVAQAPQPAAIPTDVGGGDGDYGTSGNGGGIFGPGNGPIGTVIHGGGVGDDNCDPATDGRYPGRARRPVYIPNPGGMGAGRFPTSRPSGGTTFPGRTGSRRRP